MKADFRIKKNIHVHRVSFANLKNLNQILTGKEKELFYELMNAESELAGTTAIEYSMIGFKWVENK